MNWKHVFCWFFCVCLYYFFFWSRNYLDWLNHHLVADIWEKVKSILEGILNSCLSYLITTVRLRRFESECTICRLSIPYALNSETSVFEFDGTELIGCRVLSCGSERKKYMAYDLHPVLIPYLVSQNSSKLRFFNQPFLSNCDFRVFSLYAHSRFQGFNL